MKTIASVAIKALEQADKNLYGPGWAANLYDTYRAWQIMSGKSMSMNAWRDFISEKIKQMILGYKGLNSKERFHWNRSMCICVSIYVMGGIKSKYETDVTITVIDHSLNLQS